MKPRPGLLLSLPFAVVLLVAPVRASQPEGTAGKLISNPLVVISGEPAGLPPITCGGFHWSEAFPAHPLDATDHLTLEMAIVPFSATSVVLGRSGLGADLVQLRFANGIVNGVPYERAGWNDVRVTVRPATQDYLLSVNGRETGPHPLESACAGQGGCFEVDFLVIRGDVLEEQVGWIDSISLVDTSAAGDTSLLGWTFDGTCSAPQAGSGAILLATPPRRLRPRD